LNKSRFFSKAVNNRGSKKPSEIATKITAISDGLKKPYKRSDFRGSY
jgi:hypothetical protein